MKTNHSAPVWYHFESFITKTDRDIKETAHVCVIIPETIAVAMETAKLYSSKEFFFEDRFVFHPVGPDKRFGTHEIKSGGGCMWTLIGSRPKSCI